jgi:hypothetical protein
MRQRGRKSPATLVALSVNGEQPRLTAPSTLNTDERALFGEPDRIDHSWPAIHRVNAPERKRQVTSGCDRTSTCASGGE